MKKKLQVGASIENVIERIRQLYMSYDVCLGICIVFVSQTMVSPCIEKRLNA